MTQPKLKMCQRCRVILHVSEFTLQPKGYLGVTATCKACRASLARLTRKQRIAQLKHPIPADPLATCVCGQARSSHPQEACPQFFERGL
jgi:hypothetical protein